MTIDDETLGAFLDGALEGDACAQVAAQLKRDPALAARLADLRALNVRIDGDFAAIAVPPAPALSETRHAPNRLAAMTLAAGLAGVALGLFGAPMLQGQKPVAHVDDDFRARGALAAALDRAPSAARQGGVEIVYTVQTGDGTWCRAFRVASRLAQEGAACRDERGWRILVIAAAAPRNPGYGPAEGEEAAVAAAIEALQAGAPLERVEEGRLIESGWRSAP